MNEREIFILDAQATLPDGTKRHFSNEEATTLMQGQLPTGLIDGDVTISWIEGTPVQILQMMGLSSLLEDEDQTKQA
jgi:hypothetical protein